MPLELNNPIPLQCWTEYWKAKEMQDRLISEWFRSDTPKTDEVTQLIKRIELFERKHKIG